MDPVTPLLLPLADRDLRAIIESYKDEPRNPKYAFRHLLLSATDPAARMKPVGASDIFWAEAMAKLERMESSDTERLWPQLVQGFKDLSDRLKLQDEVLVSDAERLKTTQANVKLVMRIVEVLEGKRFWMPLTKGETEQAQKLASIARQLKGSGVELSSRVHSLLSRARMHAVSGRLGGYFYLTGSAKIQEQSLAELQKVLQQETEAIARLGIVLKRDTRDIKIIMSEGTDMVSGKANAF